MSIPLEYKQFQGVYWLKVFSHDISNKVEFDNENDAKFVIDQKDKFSILSEINKRDKIFDCYEFLLEYEWSRYFIRWSQSDNPLTVKEFSFTEKKVTGLNIISRNFNDSSFGGLALTEREPCAPSLLNGNIKDGTWHYAIGMYKDCSGDWTHDKLAGPQTVATVQTDLWIRVNPIITHHCNNLSNNWNILFCLTLTFLYYI